MVGHKPNLVIIGNTHSNPSAEAFLIKFANISKEIGEKVCFITADPPPSFPNVRWIRIQAGSSEQQPAGFFTFAACQLRICWTLLSNRQSYDRSIVLATPFLLPVVLLKILGKRVFLHIDGKPDNSLARLCSRINFALANSLMTEAWALLDFWRIRDRAKASRCTLYVDPVLFNRKRLLHDRKRIVGFVGGLERGKGVAELMEAIRLLNQQGRTQAYIIAGSGRLEEDVRRLSLDCNNVEFRGQIPWTAVADTLNECQLVVVPSYTEGLPNIMLEAMACGTPVLATPVGGIPDVIVDGETGFIMSNNSPKSIASNILRVLDHPSLGQVAENALKFARTEFAYEISVRRYSQVICRQSGELD